MTNVRVNYNTYTDVTEEKDPDDRWSRESTSSSTHIESISKVPDNRYGELSVPFELDDTKIYYLLYGIYSTGDSFGRDECGRVDFVGLYEDKDLAYENLKRLEAHHEMYREINSFSRYRILSKGEKKHLKKLQKDFQEFSVDLITEDGATYVYGVPWHGYFEHLCEMEVQSILVDNETS